MTEQVLVTGGAGFIGRHLCEELLARGKRVRVLDCLVEQVHGPSAPASLPDGVELLVGDVRDRERVVTALKGIDAVVHLAAEVGVGQSMYEVERYVSANEVGTAVLFEALIAHRVRRVVTASSMSIYGEGLYRTADGEPVESTAGYERCGWEWCDADGRALVPVPTPEWKRPDLSSIYALGKFVQERITHVMGKAYGMESVCLRLFNVYGPGQALSNPYTGVLAIFASRLLNGRPPMIFEDGEQRRDFVHVSDVARAFADALDRPGLAGETCNVGSGTDRSVRDVAAALAVAMGREDLTPEIVGKGRAGDIRHCFCDSHLARERLGFVARERFEDRLAELAQWVAGQTIVDRVAEARAQLESRGLVA